MSNFSRPVPSHLRGQSMGASQQSTFLQQKIADKKTELANLKDLQALSGGLADQMQMLADKLQTLSNGTEAVAAVLSNWHNVLRAINMASTIMPKPKEDDDDPEARQETEPPLPQTLVRIPTQHAPAVIEQANAGAAAAAE
ncbi:DASH complex subunit Dad2-domain-containing protein [Boeremia exigua]|uniref:DASH complex subunit Dad2-domain-containing protein n=1 Tax=Boeremia exigua TaxID=749465 RepID=UPI001E8D656B|nr:DASH complex subunit Dad2-domain-containing protein [Boeremia exigua]KAH6639628.1 DASH complex subunit Dad2-domain-containing protein [Boeremia exigua]